MEKNIYAYILRYSKRQQVIITLIAAASLPFLYAFYELPKRIINEAIQGKKITFPTDFLSMSFDQIGYLFTLCGLFLLLVLINQSFKYLINVYKGLSGERMLRRLRYDLYSRVLLFPQPTFRKMSSGEITQMINAEVEPLGGFIGDAFSTPAFQGGTLLVIFGFVIYQDVWLAAAAIMFYPVQFYVIPKLQRRVNLMAKTRVQLVRGLSQKIGETIGGVQEVHASNAARLELATISRRLGDIFETRFKIFVWKFIIKFINNTVNQLGPFFFYSVGGYFVINGRLELGTLVAVIAANKDLAAPWKELLNYYQRREDARIKYDQVMEQFQPPGLMDSNLQLSEPESVEKLSGVFEGSGVRLEDDTGHALIDGATFQIDKGDHVAVVGAGSSGKDHLATLLARLMVPSGGSLRVDNLKLEDLPEAVTGRRIGFVGANAYMFATTVRDNLTYGLKHRPLVPAVYDDVAGAARAKWELEASRSGNSTDDLAADWIDYEAAGVADAAAMTPRILEVLEMVDLERDIYELGLRGTIDPAKRPDLTDSVLKTRVAFQQRLAADPVLSPLVERFDVERFNENATVGENLLFGRPVGNVFDLDHLAAHPYVLEVLERAELTDDMLDAGRHVASTMVELFADLPPGHEFFERYAFISHEDLPAFQALLARIGREGVGALKPEERAILLSLPFQVSPARHRLDVVTETFKEKLLIARKVFADNMPSDIEGAVEHFDQQRYTAAASLQDNILFGKLAYGHARGAERIGAVIAEVVDQLDLRREVMAVGLDYHVGIGGGRLSSVQRQKLGIARAILKRPDLLIMNEATATIDGAGQTHILDALLKEFKGRGLIWILHRASIANQFNQVIVMQGGKVVDQGTFESVSQPGSTLQELIGTE
ncbi:MAG: putative ABC transport system ATP-binding protein [Alphaproteobacteria bacterium]